MSSPDPPPLPPHISKHQPQQEQPQQAQPHRRCESKSLLYILNHGGGGGEDPDKAHDEQTAVQMFFDQIYQRSVAIYHTPCTSTSGSTGSRHRSSSTAPNPPVYTSWAPTTPSDDKYSNTESSSSSSNPLQDVFENGHSILYDLMNEHITLQDASESTAVTQTKHIHPNDILLFHNQQIVSRDIHNSSDDENVILKYCSTVICPSLRTATTTTEATDDDVDTHTHTPTATTVVNLHAAYLDGCSIVMNHADTIHPYMAHLCQDLQDSFPHVYANVYLTPLSSQTVPAHADDRDVFIIQVVGCKLWTIYTNIPIPYPYPSEQVGKSSTLPVPDQVLHGPILFQSILQPGDVLYIPRGYVHEAQCVTSSTPSVQQQQQPSSSTSSSSLFGSFHITIAIATHDWSLLGLLQSATSDLLSSTQLLPVDYRKAIDRQFGQQPTLKTPLPQHKNLNNITSTITTTDNNTTESNHNRHQHHDPSVVSNEAVIQLQQQIDTVLQLFRREFTVSNINQALYNKYTFHNQRASQQRHQMMQQYVIKQQQQHRKNNSVRADDLLTTVGYDAAQTVTLHTYIRAVTDLEKKLIAAYQGQQRRNMTATATLSSIPQQIGLHVREDIYDDIMTIIQHVKSDTKVPKWYQVYQLRSLLQHDQVNADSGSHDNEIHQSHPLPRTQNTGATTIDSNNLICDITLLSLARRCVELGAFAVVPDPIPPSE